MFESFTFKALKYYASNFLEMKGGHVV